LGMIVLGALAVPYICRKARGNDRRGTQGGGQGFDRTMTSTVRAGSVTSHVLRNDVLQQHIDVRTRVERALYPFSDWRQLGSEN
jgi:hypothetical protein